MSITDPASVVRLVEPSWMDLALMPPAVMFAPVGSIHDVPPSVTSPYGMMLASPAVEFTADTDVILPVVSVNS